MKTAVARVALQHFAAVKGRNTALTADWNATTSGLQKLQFDARDSLLVVDELKENKHLLTAESVIQSQGNLSGRLRMNVDQTLKQALPPRGSLLSTGEVDPRLQSTLGRVLSAEIAKNDIDLPVLSRLQAAGDEELYALLTASYIQWLAPRLDDIRAQHTQMTTEIRTQIEANKDLNGVHPRYPEMAAQLVAAYQLFMGFAVERNLITLIDAESHVKRAREILLWLGGAQADLQEQSKLGRRFLDLIVSALSSGRCHLANADSNQEPHELQAACGWRLDPSSDGHGVWVIPGGSKCAGFISCVDGMVYLEPTECLIIASELAGKQGNNQSFANVNRELVQEGLVQVHEENGKRRSTARNESTIPGGDTTM